MFLSISSGDIVYAGITAIGTVNGYRFDDAHLRAIARIIGFGPAALGSRGLATADHPFGHRCRASVAHGAMPYGVFGDIR